MQKQQDLKVLQKRTSILQNQDIFTKSKVSVLANNTLPKISDVFMTVILPFMLFNNLHAIPCEINAIHCEIKTFPLTYSSPLCLVATKASNS